MHTISKETLVAFYDAHWEDMKKYIIGRYLTGINAHGIYFRNNGGEPIVVHNKAEFLALVQQKYMTQIIPELGLCDHPDETKELLIDMDSPFPFERNKALILDCLRFAQQNIPKSLKPTMEVVSTASKSFHLRICINTFMSWNDGKNLLEKAVIAPFYEKHGSSVTFPSTVRMPSRAEKVNKVHLDMSSMKRRGAVRCPYSFYKDTNRYAMPLVSIAEIDAFLLERASVPIA